jgi:hypothetical protein
MRKAYLFVAMIAAILAFQVLHWSSVPPIARNLPSKISVADTEFKGRLKSRYPVGMAESDLVHDLNEQGFRPPVSYRDSKYTTFSRASIPCELTWTVIWHADPEGKLIDVEGSYSAACP